MECWFGSADDVAKCVGILRLWVEWAKPFVSIVLDLLGIGSLLSVAAFLWLFNKYRRETDRFEAREKELSDAVAEAAKKQRDAEQQAGSAQHQLTLALNALEATNSAGGIGSIVLDDLASYRSKVELLRSSLGSDDAAFWSKPIEAKHKPANRDNNLRNSIPVLMFANQKGGVGKTTLATNIAAYFADRGERVLVVDLDYQGSATALMFSQSDGYDPDASTSLIDLLFDDNLNELWASACIKRAAPNLDYIPCWYSFQNTERQLEYRWAMSETNDDVRLRLSRAIHSPQVQETYNRVIVDAPPRFTTGFINGLCASTHLFVPSVVDRLSAAAVGTFATQFKKVRDAANPVVEFSGIIGTMTPQQALSARSADPMERANQSVRRVLGSSVDYFMRNATMARTAAVSYSTDEGIAYLNADARTKKMFQNIGREISDRTDKRVKHAERPNGELSTPNGVFA